ncbi:coiled-coil domain-containing protein 62 [Solea solea]|uniref:coiled-coil domain-containing protein 62 n=1 Tax=Solea solea TaxID=90069 RepID=UPI00272B1E4C|nr:coiled-coil domain-containing protein 62 [Solea solea]
MDGGRRSASDGRAHGKAFACSPLGSSQAEFWHSTPVKKENGGPPLTVTQNTVLTSLDTTAKQNSHFDSEFPVKDLSGSTIQRQRRELQLLMSELKDRERELNNMAASHHKQLYIWEQDRQKVLSLEQRCSCLDEELQKRNEMIRVLTKHAWTVENRVKEVQKELSVAQEQLQEFEQKQQHISQKCQDFEDKNQSLNSTLMSLSSQFGSLQVKDEELSSMLKLKDKDLTEASSHIVDLSGRLRDLETSLTDSRSRENKLQRDLEERKLRYKETRHEVTSLKEQLQQQITQSSTQREEIIRLKQELQLLHRDLALSGESDTWKDDLLEMAHSKQERTMSELRCLRQVCENQRNDLQLLQLNLESARETLREKTKHALLLSQEELSRSPPSFRGENSAPGHETSTLPGATIQQRPVNNDRGIFSSHVIDGDDPLSSSFLQQLRDEIMPHHLRTHSFSYNSGPAVSYYATEPLHSQKVQSPQHHHHQNPCSPPQKAGETPPKACPQPGVSRPSGCLHTD